MEPCSYREEVEYPARSIFTLVTCSYEINDARTFLFAVEVDEEGNQIPMDEEYKEKMETVLEKKLKASENISDEKENKVLENRKCYDILRIRNMQKYVCSIKNGS